MWAFHVDIVSQLRRLGAHLEFRHMEFAMKSAMLRTAMKSRVLAECRHRIASAADSDDALFCASIRPWALCLSPERLGACLEEAYTIPGMIAIGDCPKTQAKIYSLLTELELQQRFAKKIREREPPTARCGHFMWTL